MKEEIWKDIPDYEGLYQVSNLGRVKSLPKEWVSGNNSVRSHKGKILKTHINKQGYVDISLNKDSIRKTHKVHKLVAMAFLNHEKCGHILVIDHINDNRSDNRLENLQIVTQRFNAYKTQGKYSSKYKGVSWCNIHKRFISTIYVNGKTIRLGYFKSEEEASEYYNNALIAISNGSNIITKKKTKTSKYKGVYFDKSRKKYCSRITINGKVKYLGLYDCELKAHLAYKNKLKEIS